MLLIAIMSARASPRTLKRTHRTLIFLRPSLQVGLDQNCNQENPAQSDGYYILTHTRITDWMCTSTKCKTARSLKRKSKPNKVLTGSTHANEREQRRTTDWKCYSTMQTMSQTTYGVLLFIPEMKRAKLAWVSGQITKSVSSEPVVRRVIMASHGSRERCAYVSTTPPYSVTIARFAIGPSASTTNLTKTQIILFSYRMTPETLP